MSNLSGRIGRLESKAPTTAATDDLAAMCRRCKMLLEVLEPHEIGKRDELLQTIRAIERGEVTLDDPPPWIAMKEHVGCRRGYGPSWTTKRKLPWCRFKLTSGKAAILTGLSPFLFMKVGNRVGNQNQGKEKGLKFFA